MECAICIQDNDHRSIKPYFCNHLFHEECERNWKGNCPCCRSEKNDFPYLGHVIVIKYKNSRYMNKGKLLSIYKHSGNDYLTFEDFRIIDFDRGVEEESIGHFSIRIDYKNIESITTV